MLKNTAKAATEVDVKGMIDELVANAHSALKIMKTFDQEKIDHIVHRMAIAGLDHHMELAKLAVDETGRGVWEDKAIKNMFATEEIWHSIKNNKTVGVINEDKQRGFGIHRRTNWGYCRDAVTNPTSTTIFKSEISIKTRNPIIFAFHPGAQKVFSACVGGHSGGS